MKRPIPVLIAMTMTAGLIHPYGARAETIAVLLRCVAQLPEKLRRVVRAGLRGEKATALAEELDRTVSFPDSGRVTLASGWRPHPARAG